MLPFGLKIAWFCLSLSGLLSCWATLLTFTHAVGAYWPLLYCVGCTLLQGVFCLGMIWKMNPFRMSKDFCIAQSILIGSGTFLMTGVAAAFSMATSLAVLKPKTWGDKGRTVLIWRRIYYLPVAVFPVLATALQIGITLRYRLDSRSDDMHCDYFNPLWIRFLGYAGTPFILSIPCFYLSIKSIIRVYKTNRHLQRSRNPDMDIDHFTALPRRPKEVQMAHAISPSPSSDFSPTSYREPLSPALTSTALGSRKFHMPFSPPPLSLDNLNSSISSNPETDEQDSPVSSSFPTFVHPPHAGTVSINPDGISQEFVSQPKDDWREILGAAHTPEPDKRSSMKWNDDDKSDFDYRKEDDYDGVITEESETYTPRHMPSTIGRRSRRPPPPTLSSAVWRMLLFQVSFTLVQVIACITTLVDVIKRRPPSPFGTQHVALLLAAWGPVIIFVHLPVVRSTFIFKRPWK